MSAALTKLKSGEEHAIDLSEVMCPICLSIFIEPVRMPCAHILCMTCFTSNVDQSSLCCPICRARISSWCRKATKQNTLIETQLWKFIQKRFAGNVASRLAGLDDEDVDDMFPCLPMHQFASQGAIKTEFEIEMSRVREEESKMREEEERLSAHLAEQFLEEERQALVKAKEQEAKDQEMAEKLWESTPPAPIKTTRVLRNIGNQPKTGEKSPKTTPVSRKHRSVFEMLKSNKDNSIQPQIDNEQLVNIGTPEKNHPNLAETVLRTPKRREPEAFITEALTQSPLSRYSMRLAGVMMVDLYEQSLLSKTEEPLGDFKIEFEVEKEIEPFMDENALSIDQEMLEEQKFIEEKLRQEKLDEEFARKLQEETINSVPISNQKNYAETPSKTPSQNMLIRKRKVEPDESPTTGGEKKRRQMSLLECSPYLLSGGKENYFPALHSKNSNKTNSSERSKIFKKVKDYTPSDSDIKENKPDLQIIPKEETEVNVSRETEPTAQTPKTEDKGKRTSWGWSSSPSVRKKLLMFKSKLELDLNESEPNQLIQIKEDKEDSNNKFSAIVEESSNTHITIVEKAEENAELQQEYKSLDRSKQEKKDEEIAKRLQQEADQECKSDQQRNINLRTTSTIGDKQKPASEMNNLTRKQRSLIESFKNINTERYPKPLIKMQSRVKEAPIDIVEKEEDVGLQPEDNYESLDRLKQETEDEEIAKRLQQEADEECKSDHQRQGHLRTTSTLGEKQKPKSEMNNSARKQRSLIESFKNINKERSPKPLIKMQPKVKEGSTDIVEKAITEEDVGLQQEDNYESLDRLKQEREDEEIAKRLQQEADEECKSDHQRQGHLRTPSTLGEMQKPKSEMNNSARKQRSLIESFKNINKERSPKPLIKIQPCIKEAQRPKTSSRKPCKTKHKVIPCKKCQGCLSENCGKCTSCRDMPRFGGRGVAKQKCVYRKCINPIKTSCDICRK